MVSIEQFILFYKEATPLGAEITVILHAAFKFPFSFHMATVINKYVAVASVEMKL